MTESLADAVLAVDGGGTRCRVACAIAGSVCQVEAGSANVSTDFNGAVGQIRAGLDALAGKLGVDPRSLIGLPAFVGLAGVTDAALAQRLKDAVGFACARVEDDRPAAVRGALGAQDGVVVHCGTGSFLASQRNRVMRFAGGWGPVLGDEASAQWVGRQALSRTLSALDGVHPRSDLTRSLLSDLGGAPGIVQFAGRATPFQFGELAPQVTKAAGNGDVVAVRIMRAGADYVVETAGQLGWQSGVTICLTGGIAKHYADYLPPDMQSCIRPPLGEPMAGALELAREVQHEYH